MKALKFSEIYRGQLVVLTDSYTPQVYTVAEVDRELKRVVLQWREGKHMSLQGYFGPCYVPTSEQIEYSIAANGPLVTVKEVVDWA